LDDFYGATYKQAVESGKISVAELDRACPARPPSEFGKWHRDFPVQKSVIDVQAAWRLPAFLAERSIVLLKNEKGILPLDPAGFGRSQSLAHTPTPAYDFRRRGFRTSGSAGEQGT